MARDDSCNALYFPYGRRKFGGVFCRLEPGHVGDHWCEAEDEMSEEDLDRSSHFWCLDARRLIARPVSTSMCTKQTPGPLNCAHSANYSRISGSILTASHILLK